VAVAVPTLSPLGKSVVRPYYSTFSQRYNIPSKNMSFSPHSERRPFQTIVAESPPSINDSFATIHRLSVVFLLSSRPALRIRTFLSRITHGIVSQHPVVNNESTFNNIQEEMHRDTSEKWTLLQAHYGPNPYWTPLEQANQEPIGATCQTLFAFNRNIGSEYVLAVVRRPDSDYPLVLHAGTTTVREAAETADPHLKTLITSITWGESQDNIGDLPFSSILAKRKSHPKGLIINAGEGMSFNFLGITFYSSCLAHSLASPQKISRKPPVNLSQYLLISYPLSWTWRWNQCSHFF
jgi:hypothetical protein